MIEDLREIFISFIKIINRKYEVIIGWMIIIITFLTMLYINDFNRIKFIISYFLILLLLLLIEIMFEKKNNREKGFPKVNKRFTIKIDEELVTIKKENWKEAILYLYEIENYLGK